MRAPDQPRRVRERLRRLTPRARAALALAFTVTLVLAGFLYSERRQLRQFVKSLTVPPTTAVHVTPVALTPGATSAHTVTTADWTTYHYDIARTGFVPGAPDPRQLTKLWQHPLDGAVFAEPLVIGGEVIAVTEHDSLYALDAGTGEVRWHTSVGTPVPLSDLPCGNIDPLGITGTPVYDPQTDVVYAVAEIQGPAHVLVGLDPGTGQVKVRRLIDPPGANPQTLQQRAALALYRGMIYIAFGGLYGDCGDYRGRLVGVRDDGTGPLLTFAVPTAREGAIWAPPGPAIDASGNLYVTVGNGASTGGAWDHTDSVLRLSPTLHLDDAFAPVQWPQDNAADLDLGSLGPILAPGGELFAAGKSGQGYLLQAGHLGGVGGQIQTIALCEGGAYGGAALSGEIAVVPCADGLREIRLAAGQRVAIGWQSPPQVNGSPIIGGNTVYSLDPAGGRLHALDVATGAQRAALDVGAASRFATPALSHDTLFVGTMTGVVAVRIG